MEPKSGLREDFEYLPYGLFKCAISAGMRYAYEYDVMGCPSRKIASGRTLLALGYDKNGNRANQTDVTGKEMEYHFDPLDLLSEVYDNGEKLAGYDYTPGGQRLSLVHGPVETYYGYDQDKNLTALKVLASGEVLADNQYAYDGNGNRTWRLARGEEETYTYDPCNRLTSHTKGGNYSKETKE